MTQYGTWSVYAGRDAVLLAAVLLVIAGVCAFVGARLRRPVGVTRPGWVVGSLLVAMWVLSFLNLGIAVLTYMRALTQQAGNVTLPTNPISPVTYASALLTFVAIAYLSRRHGWRIALGSALVGTIAAPMIFELPFDLIVVARTYSPQPALEYRLLYFLPLFLWEIASYALLTLSPIARLSKYTLFSLAAMFFVFAVWASFGFGYPFYAVPIALNVGSKILCFVTAVTLFLPDQTEHRRLSLDIGGFGEASLPRR